MSLDDANPHANLDAMSDEDLDALEYGVVKMDLSGNVTGYNKAEADAAGFTKELATGGAVVPNTGHDDGQYVHRTRGF